MQFFWSSVSQILRKEILTNPKKPDAIFLLIPFSKIKKGTLTNPENPNTIFSLSLFQILKNRILTNPQKLAQYFA